MYNVLSDYPNQVDDLNFISDVSIGTEHIYKDHQELLNQCRYTDASEYLKSQENITPMVADLFNMLEARILKTQEYLLQKESTRKISYSDLEPENVNDTPIWISTNKGEMI